MSFNRQRVLEAARLAIDGELTEVAAEGRPDEAIVAAGVSQIAMTARCRASRSSVRRSFRQVGADGLT